MSSASAVLEEALRVHLVPALRHHGFSFDGKRTFRRFKANDVVEIVNVQLGQRSLQGRFTVNLGLFFASDSISVTPAKAREADCPLERRERLGCLVSPGIPSLAAVPRIGFVFGPKDTWWPFSDDPAQTAAQMRSVTKALMAHGLAWFAARGS